MKFMNDLFAQRRSAVRAATFLSLLAASFTLACSSDPPGLQFPGQCSEGQIVCDGVCVAGPVCNAAPGAGGVVGGTGAASSIGGSTGGILTGGGGLGPAAGGGVSTGGAIGVGGGGPGTGGGATTECAINITKSEFGMIQTVGVVEFTTDATPVSAAIEFGLDTTYGMTAPVDLAEPNYKTYLLGMVAETTYHYRVAVTTAAGTCHSPDQTLLTGSYANGGPTAFMPQAGPSSAQPAPGFITAAYGIGGGGSWGFIFNDAGQVVWSFQFPGGAGFNSGITRALMSWDGKYMYARDLGPFDAGSGGAIHRVNMDGTGLETLSVTGGHHHDMTVTPTGIAYIAKTQMGQCDHIMVADPDGSNSHSLIDLWEALQYFPDAGSMEMCHVNAIRYSAEGDYFTVSDREKDVIVKVSGDGTVLQAIGQAASPSQPYAVTAQDSGTKWRVQHGHHLYADDKLLVFSNGSFQGGTSRMLHYTINGGTATLDWEYSEMGSSPTLSDVQALPNGNFLVTKSQGGTMDEVDPNQQRIRRFSAQSFGYANHRPTLYGPPPR